MIDLSILVCSLVNRGNTFLPNILRSLDDQLARMGEDAQRVEVLVLTDNKRMTVGTKRNRLLNLAQGTYSVFVDDDDRISDDYVSSLLEATKYDRDVITFAASVSINGGRQKPCYYSIVFSKNLNTYRQYQRTPNHISCVKTELARTAGFPDIMFGEDDQYAAALKPLLKTEKNINKTLYYYDYNSNTSETIAHKDDNKRITKEPVNNAPIVDVVFISKALNTKDVAMAQKAIDTAIAGAAPHSLNIVVLEQTPGVTYKNAKTIHKPDNFNYNSFANYGAGLFKSEWILICNNDLVFHSGWLDELLAVNHPLVSPHEPTDKRQARLFRNEIGDVNGRHISGWCFMIKRSLWEKMGGFDDEVEFWCSDDVVIEQAKQLGVLPMVVKNSVVTHLGSQTLNRLPNKESLKWKSVFIFNKKYGQQKFVCNQTYKEWLIENKVEMSTP